MKHRISVCQQVSGVQTIISKKAFASSLIRIDKKMRQDKERLKYRMSSHFTSSLDSFLYLEDPRTKKKCMEVTPNAKSSLLHQANRGEKKLKLPINSSASGEWEKTNQEANWAFFEIACAFFVTRIARSKLGFKNEFPEPLNVHISMMVQPLRLCIFLIHYLSPPSQFITHAILYGQPLHF